MSDVEIKRITSLLAALLAAAQDKRLCSPEGCEHAMRLRWKRGHSVCVVCRTVLLEDWGLFSAEPWEGRQ